MIILAILSQLIAQFIEPKLRIPVFSILAFALYVTSGGIILGIILYFAGVLVIPNMASVAHWETLPGLLKKAGTGYLVNTQGESNETS